MTFPVGAWVRDPGMARLTGGIDRGRFQATGGEIIGTGTIGGRLVYRIQFASSQSVVFAAAAECYECAAIDDDAHEAWCCSGPCGPARGAEHAPGWGVTTEALRAWEATRVRREIERDLMEHA